MRAIRAVLDRIDAVDISSFARCLRRRYHPVYSAAESLNPSTLLRSSLHRSGEERMQDIVDEVLAQGGWTARTHRLRGQKLVKSRPSIRLAVTMTCSPKVCERAACVMKALAKRK